ncbi:MAG TPA: DUF4252 domain-containing protein [Thermoanaerobaculia bacterium]|nr:DUF4252 domain-containing protein [Thermoanaerobaculia bacterium]
MKRALLTLLIAASLTIPASAQQINLDFPGLADRASEVVDVTLDRNMLRLAAKFLSEEPDERAARDMVVKLEGIYVRSYEFERDGEYDRAIIDRLRGQLGAGWQKIVNVRSKTRENVEIYTQNSGDKISGLVIISAEPRELTIVNLVGPIDLDRLAGLEGQFGIPKISKSSKEMP